MTEKFMMKPAVKPVKPA